MNDHDLLIVVKETVIELKKAMTNHLKHHAKAVNRVWFVLGGIGLLFGQAGIALLIWGLSK